jgi:cation diffusion facilitator family transporter
MSQPRSVAAITSLVVGSALLATKLVAYLLTGSAAVLSDALESTVNVVAAGFAWFSVRLSQEPPDDNHPYGHGKVEFLSAAFEGGLIFLAGILIIFNAAKDLIVGVELRNLDQGLWLVGGAAVVNFLLGLYLVRTGKKTHSLALEADGKHVLTDVWTSAMVLVGLALVMFTGRTWVDPLVAALAGANILHVGLKLVRQAVAGIMDEADVGDLEMIKAALRGIDDPRLAGWSDVRSRHQGPFHHVDLTVYVPEETPIPDAHALAQRVEHTISETLGEAQVLVRIQPARGGAPIAAE